MNNPMTIENWSEILPITMRASITAYRNRRLIQNWWKRLLVFSGLGNTNIVIVGRPSTGKSVLSSMMHGEINNLIWRLPDTSLNVESKAIQLGNWTQTVRILPGQSSKQRDQGLHEAFSRHKSLEGVIYVTDWGYTLIRDETIAKKMIKEDKIETIDDLRNLHLKQEIYDFNQVCERIREAHSCRKVPRWLLVVVNKVDLFYPKIDESQNYYHPNMNSPFSEIIKKLVSDVGNNNIYCASAPICSWETDLTWNNQVIKSAINGTENRRALLLNLIKQIANFSSNCNVAQ